MKKIRVLQMITKGDWAGAQRVLYEICRYVKENEACNIEMEVSVGDNGLLAEKLRSLGIKVFILNNLKHSINPIIDARGYKEVKKILLNNKYDVIHCHSTKAGILGRLAAHRLQVGKVIYTVHGFWPILQYKGVKRKTAAMLERFMASRTTDMVFISRSDIETAKELSLYSPEKARLIYNSINVTKTESGILRQELGLQRDTRIIGNLARVDEQKNPLLFIETAREYFNKYPGDRTVFVWIGEGALIDSALARVQEYNLKNNVFFPGFRDEGENYLADFDLLLMTSKWEGVPITILEALELKVPILASDVGGIREIIGEENVYSLTEAGWDIASKLKRSRIPVNKSFSQMAENYVKLYRG